MRAGFSAIASYREPLFEEEEEKTMRKLFTASLFAFAVSMAVNAAQAKVIVEFAYPYAGLFDVTYEKILPKFYEQYPDIEIKIRAPYENYEDGTNSMLRA